MRQSHRAGERMFIDYSGKKLHLVDPNSGEVTTVELFVAVLGASNYTYAEATMSQSLPDWIASNTRALEFFGGVPEVLVPDQLKSAVTTSCRYEPEINRTYAAMATHYDTVVIPARPRKPKDKAKVEVAVQVVQRWIVARLRNEVFYSLQRLNQRIRELLDDLNNRIMRSVGKSRRELFETIERPCLRPLPQTRFVPSDWKAAGCGSAGTTV